MPSRARTPSIAATSAACRYSSRERKNRSNDGSAISIAQTIPPPWHAARRLEGYPQAERIAPDSALRQCVVMGRDDWYRNSRWDLQIETVYLTKLARARKKDQYLATQASCIADAHPRDALQLLDMYFALGDSFGEAGAHLTRARAHLALGQDAAAVDSYEASIAAQARKPYNRVSAWRPYGLYAIRAHRPDLCARAVEASEEDRDSIPFPASQFAFWAIRAEVARHERRLEDARDFANRALAAAAATRSPFDYHQALGLVGEDSRDIVAAMKRIAAPAAREKFARLVRRAGVGEGRRRS